MQSVNSLLQEFKSFASAYRNRQYPSFVYGEGIVNNFVPVFYYHRIDQISFRNHLQYLKQNGYTTVNGDALFALIDQGEGWTGKEIAITIDDGLDDLYTVIYPILQEYDLTAIAYIVPAWIGKDRFVTWPQVREMHESGLVDFQSHSMNHAAIFTSPKIVDFFNPDYRWKSLWEIPIVRQEDERSSSKIPAFGTPIYQSSSRLSDDRRYFPDYRIRQVCRDYVANNGGREFFHALDWRHKLLRVVNNCRGINHVESYESDNLQKDFILHEVEASKFAIEKHLAGKGVRHFSFPWHIAGSLVKESLFKAGYRTMSIGLSNSRQNRRLNGKVIEVTRVNGDFLPTLPGQGRQNFWKIMLQKANRRIQYGTTY